MRLSTTHKKRLEQQLSGYAKKDVAIDDSSATTCVYAFVDELSMYRIAERMRLMDNFSYGFSVPFNSHYICLDLEATFKAYEVLGQ